MLSGLVIMASMIENWWIVAFMGYLVIWQLFIFIYKLFVYELPFSIVANSFDETIYFMVGVSIFVALVKSKIKLEVFYNVICVSTVLQVGIAISQHLGFDPFLYFLNIFFYAVPLLEGTRMTGTLVNNNFLAAYIAITLPFFFRGKTVFCDQTIFGVKVTRVPYGWFYFIPLIFYVLYITKTTSAFIPALIGTAVYFSAFSFMSTMVWLMICVVGFYYIFIYHPFWGAHYNDRFDMWKEALGLSFKSLFTTVFGFGPAASWSRPHPMHSEWIQCMHQFGIVGITLLTGYVVTIYRKNRMLFSAFVIAVINMAGNSSIHLSPSAFLIIIIAGLIERERINYG
jgi:hypothetical protein